MKAFWLRSRARFMARSRRERGLLLACTLVLVLGLGAMLFIEPAYKQRMQLQRQIEQQTKDLAALSPQVQALQQRQRNPDAAVKAQLKALRDQLQLADGEFAQVQRALVPPQEMGQLLGGLLHSHRGLQLVSLKSLPAMSVSELIGAPKVAAPASSAASSSTPSQNKDSRDAWLYRHGVEITVQGSYADMQAYLAALENLPRRVYWGELKIDAQKWPDNTLTVTVYTLSLEKTWWRV